MVFPQYFVWPINHPSVDLGIQHLCNGQMGAQVSLVPSSFTNKEYAQRREFRLVEMKKEGGGKYGEGSFS